MTLASLLQKVIGILGAAEIPYMLTGSLAAAFYATPRATQDIDLVVEAMPNQLGVLTDLLSSAGFFVSSAPAMEASVHEGQFNAIDPETGWKVDFIVRKSRPFSVSEFERRIPRTALGLELFMATPEDLVIAKLEWAKKGDSELQLKDVRAILKAAVPEFDWSYVEFWIRELALGDQWQAVRPISIPESVDPGSA
ncbi:MAG: hypothetical protein ABIF09_14925 [Gemmatimonadota bacterium]